MVAILTLPSISQSYLFTLAVHQRMAVGMKQHTIPQSIRPAVHTPDDVMVVPAGFLLIACPHRAQSPFCLRKMLSICPDNAASAASV